MNSIVAAIKPSATLAIAAQAREMAAQGVRVHSFAAGEPDFDTPQVVKDAACRAIAEGKTKYTAARGMPGLCAAVARKFAEKNGISYDPATEILVSSGGKQSLCYAFQALLERGDAVLIPSPYWLSYPEMVRIAGGEPVFVPTKAADGWKVTPASLEKAVAAAGGRAKALVLNYPSNPTGAVYSGEELRAVGEAALRLGLWIVADEMYERMVYTGAPFVSVASLSPELRERTVTVNGCSKAYAMTGWRIGYAGAPARVASLMATCQSHLASNPCTPAQYAALAALEDPEAERAVQPMLKAFAARAELIYSLLSKIEGVSLSKPEGAFYVFPDVSSFGVGSVEFCSRLLREESVAAVPGLPFGDDGCVRFSYACSTETIEEGIARVAKFCARLRAAKGA
ncbi:MAG: pyridoxal phosphate-dependent aminotransferase [Kiritimatiellae bacterium]|nr:pyridoxal phosphate-dependent aminotransferase [Kiritimatiellia bacterium]